MIWKISECRQFIHACNYVTRNPVKHYMVIDGHRCSFTDCERHASKNSEIVSAAEEILQSRVYSLKKYELQSLTDFLRLLQKRIRIEYVPWYSRIFLPNMTRNQVLNERITALVIKIRQAQVSPRQRSYTAGIRSWQKLPPAQTYTQFFEKLNHPRQV